jgi:hypothetical protein
MFGQERSLQIDKAARLVRATFVPPLMGNSTSSQLSTNANPKRRFWRKRSWKLSRFHLGCTSARNHSTESLDLMQDTSKLFNEKAVLVDHDRQPSPVSQVGYALTPSLLAYSPVISNMHLETDTEAAYQDFLREFPGTSL